VVITIEDKARELLDNWRTAHRLRLERGLMLAIMRSKTGMTARTSELYPLLKENQRKYSYTKGVKIKKLLEAMVSSEPRR